MEGIEIFKLKISWGCDIYEELPELGEEKTAFLEYLKTHSEYDKENQESSFNGNSEKAYRFLRPFIIRFKDASLEIIFYAMEGGRDMYCKCSWYLESLEEGEEIPPDITDIVSQDEIVYPDDWYANWAEEHADEVEDYLCENNIEFEFKFEADGWWEFTDAFPEAKEEFFDMLDGM